MFQVQISFKFTRFNYSPSAIRSCFSQPCFLCNGVERPYPSNSMVVMALTLVFFAEGSEGLTFLGVGGRSTDFWVRWGMAMVVKRLKGTNFSTRLVSMYLKDIANVNKFRRSKRQYINTSQDLLHFRFIVGRCRDHGYATFGVPTRCAIRIYLNPIPN